MSDPDDASGALPPEVPEEFAEAYRRAYEEALQHGEPPAEAHEAGMDAVPDVEHTSVLEPEEGFRQAQPTDEAQPTGEAQPARSVPEPVEGSGFRQAQPADEAQPAEGRVTVYRAATRTERIRESRAFVPVLVGLLALVLIVGAYLIGRALSDGGEASAPAGGQAEESAQPWDGKVTDVKPGKVQVDCTSRPSVDAGGKQVRYDAANMTDGDPSTAWRCDGDASGQQLVIALPPGTEVGEVGLIPGYAKTDPVDGTDRYAENNRITKVRWTLASGVQVEQDLDGAADNRKMQTIRVPRTKTDELRLEILAVTKGPRNTTAISEVHVGAAGD